MLIHGDQNNTKSNTQDDHINYDEITKRKIDKHLSDINDVITEDDIKNVNTNIHSGNNDGELSQLERHNQRNSTSIWNVEESE